VDKQGSEPIKDNQENVVRQSQTQVDASGSEGRINQPSAPVTENNINTQGGDYAAGNIDKRSGTFNTISADDDLKIGGDVVGRDKITNIYQVISPPSTPLSTDEPLAPGEPPFKGLQYFDEADAGLVTPMTQLPTGTVTFLFTDIEGSTKLWEQYPEAMKAALARHDALLRQAIEANNGYAFKTVGDAFYAAFPTAPEALTAALAAQRALHAEAQGGTGELETRPVIRVRMALHTGAADQREGDYFGQPLNRVARLLSAGHGGQTLISLATQELVRDCLPPNTSLLDLGERRLKDLFRSEHVFQLNTPDLPAQFSPLKTLDAKLTNLPAQPTPFIGRERELAAVLALLRRIDVRLVTLTGPGGTGKTRLGLQAAADLLDEYEHGVFFAPLMTITNSALVIPTIASVFNIKELGGQPVDVLLKQYLAEKQLLLVIDNFEQVISAAPGIAELLSAAPYLKIIAISREKLRLYGEYEYPVPPLALPDLKKKPTVAVLSQYEAVALFIQRAKAANPNFEITEQNAQALAEICVRLDGLPLAIELAAARAKLLTPQMMLERLASRLKALTGGARDLPARQQTIRGTIDWSYNLLDEGEKRLFARLGVFVGGWTLEAAEAACGENLPMEAFDGLESLADKSLIRQTEDTGGKPRFVMLETLREYAREKLLESGEDEKACHQHLDFFFKFAEVAKSKLFGAEQIACLERLEMEHNNLRAALEWSLENNARAEVGLQLAAALWFFWYLRGYWSEGREWLEKTLAVKPEMSSVQYTLARTKALNGAGWLAGMYGLQEGSVQARVLCEESLALSRNLGEKREMAFALRTLGCVSGDDSQSEALLEESLALFREIENKWGIAEALSSLAHTAFSHNRKRALELNQESLAIRRSLGDKDGIAWSLYQLGDLAMVQGEYERARALYEESLSLFREMSSRFGLAHVLRAMGGIAWLQGNYERAITPYEESQALFRELGDKWYLSNVTVALGARAYEQGDFRRGIMLIEEGLASFQQLEDKWGAAVALRELGRVVLSEGDYERARKLYRDSLTLIREDEKAFEYERIVIMCLIGLAGVARAEKKTKRAACLLGATEKLIEEWKELFFTPLDRADYNHAVTAVRAQLEDEATFVAAWAEGRAMTLEQAVAYALEQDP